MSEVNNTGKEHEGKGSKCPVCRNHISGKPDHENWCPEYGTPVSEIDHGGHYRVIAPDNTIVCLTCEMRRLIMELAVDQDTGGSRE